MKQHVVVELIFLMINHRYQVEQVEIRLSPTMVYFMIHWVALPVLYHMMVIQIDFLLLVVLYLLV